MRVVILLTGNRAQHVRYEDFYQGLVQDVVTAPHPEPDRFVFTDSQQLLSGERTFHFIIAAHKIKPELLPRSQAKQ